MLSKAVCEKCSRKLWPEAWQRLVGDDYEGSAWDEKEEKLWNKGAVICPIKGSQGSHAYVDGDPPNHCPYRFEHAIATTMENKDG